MKKRLALFLIITILLAPLTYAQSSPSIVEAILSDPTYSSDLVHSDSNVALGKTTYSPAQSRSDAESPAAAVDGADTAWQTNFLRPVEDLYLTVDLDAMYDIEAVYIQPSDISNLAESWTLLISDDGETWREIYQGDQMAANSPIGLYFYIPVCTRYIRIQADKIQNDFGVFGLAEVAVLGKVRETEHGIRGVSVRNAINGKPVETQLPRSIIELDVETDVEEPNAIAIVSLFDENNNVVGVTFKPVDESGDVRLIVNNYLNAVAMKVYLINDWEKLTILGPIWRFDPQVTE